MKATLIQTMLIVHASFAMSSICAADEEVLWNHADAIGGALIDPAEWSEVVVLDHASKITKISMWLDARQFTPGILDDVVVRLYTTSGIQSGVPVNSLWSGVLEDIDLTEPALFTLDVPEVLVPRAFAYSTERASGLALSRLTAVPHAAHFGQWGTRASYEDGMWNNIGGIPFVPLAARFQGISTGIIPEPTALVMLIPAAIALLAYVRFRRR
jgi:hypothetical protein